MRLSEAQILTIKLLASEITEGKCQSFRVFGSRTNDEIKGGDVDLLLEFTEPVNKPALMSTLVAAKVSRALQGRKVDVLSKRLTLPH